MPRRIYKPRMYEYGDFIIVKNVYGRRIKIMNRELAFEIFEASKRLYQKKKGRTD